MILSQKYPRLFSFARDKLQSVQDFLLRDDWLQNFLLPLSTLAHNEFLDLTASIHSSSIIPHQKDVWNSSISKKGFSPSSIYQFSFAHIPTDIISSWIWKSKCQSKHKFFAWLIPRIEKLNLPLLSLLDMHFFGGTIL